MKNILLYLFITGSLIIYSCKSHDKEIQSIEQNQLSEKELLEDFDLFETIYKSANAGLYKYRSKQAIDSAFRENRSKIEQNTSYREFYNILWNVIDYTGSCHNQLSYPDSLDQLLSKQKIFFPIPIKYIDNKLYTNFNYGIIPAGSEVMAVNKVKADSLISILSKYISTDGFNTTGKCAKIETDWLPFYMYLTLGKQDFFEIEYRAINTGFTIKDKIESSTYKEFYKNYSKRYSKQFENKINEEYSFEFLDSINTAILEVHTFGMGGPQTEGHKKYATFLDSVFTKLRNKNVANLIVDIRGNGGGNDPNDLLLYSYLTCRSFKENKYAFTLFQNIPFREYYVDDDAEELANDLKKEHSVFKNNKYYQNDLFNKNWKPKANAFQGSITLLIDPYVASAGSLFAAMVKSDMNATVIGEETIGGYYGHTGHIPVTYELPNSKLLLTFSIVDLEQDVKVLKDQPVGSGIMPDFKVVQSYNDYLNQKDTQLHFAIQNIKNNNRRN